MPRARVGTLLLCAVFAASCGEPAKDAPPEGRVPDPQVAWSRPPVVILFLVDSLRADRLSIYGYPRATAPNLEALAAESAVFENASSASPRTLSSVASLMLSSFPLEHGVSADGDRIPEDAMPIAVRMQALGLRTRAVIRDPRVGRSSGLGRGFDEVTHADRLLGAKDVEDALDAPGPPPLLLYLHNTLPHISDLGNAGRSPHPMADAFGIATDPEAMERLYDADVSEVDAELGRTVEALKRAGVWDRTVFVFLSDHGVELGEHEGSGDSDWLYEERIHVPLVIHFPKGSAAGSRTSYPVSLVRVAATLYGAVTSPPMDSFGFLGGLRWTIGGCSLAAGPRLMSVLLPGGARPRAPDNLRLGGSIALRDELM